MQPSPSAFYGRPPSGSSAYFAAPPSSGMFYPGAPSPGLVLGGGAGAGVDAGAGASSFSSSSTSPYSVDAPPTNAPPTAPPPNVSVKEQLWHVFTYYAMMDNSLDPAHMTRHQLQKCARDARLVPPLLDADIEVMWMAEVNREGKTVVAAERPHNLLKQFPVRPLPAKHDEPSRRAVDRRQVRKRQGARKKRISDSEASREGAGERP